VRKQRLPLSLPLTVLVGREELVDSVRKIIATEPGRLVSLIGPSGSAMPGEPRAGRRGP